MKNPLLLVGIVLLVLGIVLIPVGLVLSFPPPCGSADYGCFINPDPNLGVGLAIGIGGGLSLFAGIITIIIGAILAARKPITSAVSGLVWGKDCRYCRGKIRVGLRKCPNCGAPV
jgi:hypothetical protein